MLSAITSQTVQGAVLSLTSNVLAQAISSYREDTPFKLSLTPIVKFTVFSLISNPPNILWQAFLEDNFPSNIPTSTAERQLHNKAPKLRTSKRNLIIKFTLDQTFGAVLNTLMFLIYMAYVNHAASATSPPWPTVEAEVRDRFWPMMIDGYKFWPAVSLVSFLWIPVDKRVVFGCSVGVLTCSGFYWFWKSRPSQFLSLLSIAATQLLPLLPHVFTITMSEMNAFVPTRERYFRSRRIKKDQPIDKPWLNQKKSVREYWVTWIPLIGAFIGACVAGFLVWDGYRSVTRNKYCPVLEDNFSMGFDESVWSKEIELGGFRFGQFEQTTLENVFVANDMLYIRPTLQDENLVENNNVIDLRSIGCTGQTWVDCMATTNTTNGTIVNPVKSGRINTKLGASIQFGRVEVVAKLPAGDWLWPSIMMLPSDDTYGGWPRSGQIDIVQSRGNDWKYKQGGNDVVSSTLHFGPNEENDGWWRNNVKRAALHTTYSTGFHTFGVEWTEKYIFTYIDSRLLQVSFTHFDLPFWEYGRFPFASSNGTSFENPWGHTGSKATPFDQKFHLVVKLGVGATNGWFEDGQSGKPWVDSEPRARRQFWDARDVWYPTWKEQGWLEIRSVKMWQQAGYNGCGWENATHFP